MEANRRWRGRCEAATVTLRRLTPLKGKSPLTLALRGNDSDFTAIDSIKRQIAVGAGAARQHSDFMAIDSISGTAAQTKGTGQRTVLKLNGYKSESCYIVVVPAPNSLAVVSCECPFAICLNTLSLNFLSYAIHLD
jgi:hypothetical protein